MPNETDLGTYEMLWDCRRCGTQKLLAKSQRFCPNCGDSQDPSWRYFPSDADKVKVEDHQYVGIDVICRACDVPNSRNAKFCMACGAELAKAKDAATRTDQVAGAGQAFVGESMKDAKADRDQKRARAETPAAVPSKISKRASIIIVAVLALIVGASFALTWKKEALVSVTGHSWQREIDVERFGPANDSAWCNEMPKLAYQVSRAREVRSHKKVPDGQTCQTRRKDNGDGTYKEAQECEPKYRDEPVYDERCRFLIDRWQHDRILRTEGKSLKQAPVWPPVVIAKPGVCLGCEREGEHREKYTVTLRREGEAKDDSCDYPQDRWSKIEDGSKWKMGFHVITGSPACASMKAP
jgi:ribosomal protein L40E